MERFIKELYGERSAGGLEIVIRRAKDKEIVYYHNYFDRGATGAEYEHLMGQAFDDLASDYDGWDGNDLDNLPDLDTRELMITCTDINTGRYFGHIDTKAGGGLSRDFWSANLDKFPPIIQREIKAGFEADKQ